MNPAARQVTIVRIYVTESRARLERVMDLLQKTGRVRGITVFRGVAGFGETPPQDSDASAPLDLPIVIEFFDTQVAVDDTIRFLRTMIAPHHIVTIPAELR